MINSSITVRWFFVFLVGIIVNSIFFLPRAEAAVTEILKKKQIEKIIELTGYDRLIEALPEFAARALQETRGAISPDVADRVSNAFAVVYEPEALKAAAREKLTQRYDENEYKAFLKYLTSPLARYMSGLELKADVNNDPESFRGFVQALDSTSNDPRVALAVRLDDATDATKVTINIQAAFFRSIFMAVDPRLEADLRLREGELDTMENEVRTSIAESTRKITVATYLYAYKDVDLKRFTQYVEQTEAVSVRKGNELLAKTLMAILNEAAIKAAEMVRPPKKNKKNPK